MADNNDIIAINAGLDTLGQKLDSLVNESKEGKTSQKALEAKLDELGKKQLALAKDLLDFKQSKDEAEFKNNEIKSIGTQFVESKAFTEFGSTKHISVDVSTKAATTTSGILDTYNVPGIITKPEQVLVIEGLIPHIPVNTTSISYLKEKATTTNAAVVKEGATKPESTFEFEKATAEISTVAHWTRITRQLANYAPAVEAFINAKMQYGLQLMIDQQLVNGDGSAGKLSGLLKTGNYTNYASDLTFATDDTLLDFAMRVKTAMEVALYVPQSLLLNPYDWAVLALLKDKQGRYILGGPNALAQKSLWGTPVITSASVPAGKFIMANFAQGATIYDGESMRVDMSESDATNFTTNLITIRVERDLGLAVETPAAIAGGDFKIPSAS